MTLQIRSTAQVAVLGTGLAAGIGLLTGSALSSGLSEQSNDLAGVYVGIIGAAASLAAVATAGPLLTRGRHFSSPAAHLATNVAIGAATLGAIGGGAAVGRNYLSGQQLATPSGQLPLYQRRYGEIWSDPARVAGVAGIGAGGAAIGAGVGLLFASKAHIKPSAIGLGIAGLAVGSTVGMVAMDPGRNVPLPTTFGIVKRE